VDLQREKIRLWPWTSAANHAGKSGVHPITSGSGSVVLIGQKDTQPLGVFTGVVSACFLGGRIEGPAREAFENIALTRALAFIEANCSRASLNVDEIVAAVGVSRATLYRLFAPLEGVASCIRAARLERARAMLSDPDTSGTIASVAYRCGFADPLYFSRAFTDFFGFRPSNLRPF
jgi:AraC-like DNA-binding protein